VDFFLFVLVTGVMFVRPTDFVPGLETVPLYYLLIVACILVSWNKLILRFSQSAFKKDRIGVLALGLLFLCFFSNLVRGDIETAFSNGTEFAKVILYYFLLVAVVDTPARLRRLLLCMVAFDLIPTILALLQYYDLINIPAFRALEEGISDDSMIGEGSAVRRLHATGNFGDPNDVCEILNTAMIFCLYGLLDRAKGIGRLFWLVPSVLFPAALVLTRSRGGFLGLIAGLGMLFWSRFGARKTILLATVALPLMFIANSGRQVSLSTSSGTSQQRIQMWITGYEFWRSSPIWGIGANQFGAKASLVAHNSFVHLLAELGFLGGTLFFGIYCYALSTMARLGSSGVTIRDPVIRRLRPYVMAAVASMAVSQMSLSHGYAIATYAMFGLATACIAMSAPIPPLNEPARASGFWFRLCRASVLFYIFLYVFVRYSVNWG